MKSGIESLENAIGRMNESFTAGVRDLLLGFDGLTKKVAKFIEYLEYAAWIMGALLGYTIMKKFKFFKPTQKIGKPPSGGTTPKGVKAPKGGPKGQNKLSKKDRGTLNQKKPKNWNNMSKSAKAKFVKGIKGVPLLSKALWLYEWGINVNEYGWNLAGFAKGTVKTVDDNKWALTGAIIGSYFGPWGKLIIEQQSTRREIKQLNTTLSNLSLNTRITNRDLEIIMTPSKV